MNDLINRTDAISRQDAIDAIYEHEFSNWCDKDEVSTILYDLPSAEKIGKWIKTTKHHADDKQEFDYYEIACSVCGSRPEKAWHLTPYCPNCGAKMKAKEEER